MNGPRPLRAHCLVRSREAAEALRRGLGDAADLAFSVKQRAGECIDLTRGKLPELLIVELDVDAAEDMAELERLAGQVNGQTAVVVVCPRPSVDALRRLMRLGIVDVLSQPVVPADLQAICRAVRRRSGVAQAGGPRPAAKLASFLKAGGGVGVTTLATQMACAAAVEATAVCLIDLDLQFGSAALQLDLPQKSSVLDLLASGEPIDGSMLRSAAARHASGVDLLPAPMPVTPLEAVDSAGVLRLLEAARAEYGLLIVDLPQAWTGWSRTVLAASDAILLVIELSLPSVHHGRRQILTLVEEGLDHIPLIVIANRVAKGIFAEASPISRGEAEQALGRPIAAEIPGDERLLRAALTGKPVGQLAGGKALAKRFAALASSVLTHPLLEVKA